jgi:hypothetical protein
LDLTDEMTEKTYLNTAVAGKEYKDRACCESGKTIPSGSCAAVISSPIVEGPSDPSITVEEIIGIVVALILVFLFLGAIFLGKERNKKQESSEHVPVHVAVPVQAGNHIHVTARDEPDVKNSWGNVTVQPMVQPPGASAPPAPVNPLFRASALVYE